MIIYYSGTDGRYGEPVDTMVFSTSVMMTFDKLGIDQKKKARFWDILRQRWGGKGRKTVASVEPVLKFRKV